MGKQSNLFKQATNAIFVCCLCASALGCAPAPKAVEGEVTLDGLPLNEAVVVFVPLVQGRGKTAAMIVDGKYALPLDDGLFPGMYRVEIVDAPPLGSAEHSKPAPATSKSKTKRRTLPPDYAHKSPFRLEVPAAKSGTALTASYELKSNPLGREN